MATHHRSPPIVRVLEFERVDLPERWNNSATRERLEAAAMNAGFRAFETRNRQLYALGVVGVVDIGDMVVEIVPKTHDKATTREGFIFLTDLLRFGGLLDDVAISDARVAAGERSILEIILAWAVRQAARNIREGLPRRYVETVEISTAVRGRVELRSLARKRPGKDFELLVRHAPLSEDNLITRIVKWLLIVIEQRTKLLSSRIMCRQLLQEMKHINIWIPSLVELDQIVPQPTELRWRPLVQMARLLLQEVSPDPVRAGTTQAVAVLYTLQGLFERALRRVFLAGLADFGLRLKRLDKYLLHRSKSDLIQMLPLKPDYLFWSKNEAHPRVVGDAKWKRIFGYEVLPKLSPADAYQLTTYLFSYRAHAACVFCPLSASSAESGIRIVPYEVAGTAKQINVIGIELVTLIASDERGADYRAELCSLLSQIFVQQNGECQGLYVGESTA